MKIIVNGKSEGFVNPSNLQAGRVYRAKDGVYVLACDEDFAVVLETGCLLSLDCFDEGDTFVEVEAALSVRE